MLNRWCESAQSKFSNFPICNANEYLLFHANILIHSTTAAICIAPSVRRARRYSSTMQRLSDFIKEIFSRNQPSFSLYPKIPLPIVLDIFACLSLSDQVCFSLCCKYLYEAYLYLIRTKKLNIARLCPPEKRPLLCLNKETNEHPRVQLLRQIENRRWRFCNECWFLHPPDKKRTHCLTGRGTPRRLTSLWRSNSSRDYFFDEESFTRHYGIVEICPCLTITFQDKIHLMEELESIEREGPGSTAILPTSLPDSLGHEFHRGRIRHRCSFADHPFAKVQVVTDFWHEGPFLNTCSDYEFEMGEDKSSKEIPSGLKTPFIFPEESVGSWMRKFFDEAGSKFSGWPKDHNISSLGGAWPKRFEIRVSRDLGDMNWPNKDWIRHCSKSWYIVRMNDW